MKKLFALALALCLLCGIAAAETATISWTDVEPVIESLGMTGDFVTFDEVAVKIWIPDGMTAVEADQLPEGFIGYFQAEDGSAISVMYVDLEGMELDAYAEQVAAAGGVEIEAGTLNGLSCLSYDYPNDDGSVNLCAAFTTEMGYVLEVAGGPATTDDEKTIVSLILASIQPVE